MFHAWALMKTNDIFSHPKSFQPFACAAELQLKMGSLTEEPNLYLCSVSKWVLLFIYAKKANQFFL
jgi:hypothetical protein